MRTLISKRQYHYFEEGEFDDIENRSLENTLAFIHNFQWDEQTNGIFRTLTGPSITIENGSGCYLKIGIYYHGKFILYYLNERNQIFCKIVDRLSEFDKNIENIFCKGINEAELNKYRDWPLQKKKHFVTKKFEYKLTLRRVISVMLLPLIFGIFLLFINLKAVNVSGIVFALGFNLLFFGTNWFLFFNYYFFSKKLYLRVSRGSDEFYFGKDERIKKYSKQEIRKIITYQNKKWNRCPWGEFCSYEIQFNDGTTIKFTNFVLSWFKFIDKFPGHNIHDKHRFIPKI